MSYARLSLDPEGYSQSSVKALAAVRGLDGAASEALRSLRGLGGMAGSDRAGQKFAHAYDTHAASVFDGLGVLATKLSHASAKFDASAVSYANAEAANSRRAQVPTGSVSASAVRFEHPVSASGGTRAMPPGWSLVEVVVSAAWPDGDSGKLRTAASTFSSLADRIDATNATHVASLMDPLDGFQAPDIAAIGSWTADLSPGASDLAQACRSVAGLCSDYAAQLDLTHAQTIRELTGLLRGGIGGVIDPSDLAATARQVEQALNGLGTWVNSVAQLVGPGLAYGSKFLSFEVDLITQSPIWTAKNPIDFFNKDVALVEQVFTGIGNEIGADQQQGLTPLQTLVNLFGASAEGQYFAQHPVGAVRDDQGIIRTGAKPPQFLLEYMNLYDMAFDLGAQVDHDQFTYTLSNGEQRTIWVWKGDYPSWGAGGEIEIFQKAPGVLGDVGVWETDPDMGLPTMSTSLQIHHDDGWDTVATFAPDKAQEWVGTYDTNEQHVRNEDIRTVSNVTFHTDEEYRVFKAAYGLDSRWTFDDNHHTATLTYEGNNH